VFQGTVSNECTGIASYEANRFVYNNALPQGLVAYTALVAYDAPYNDLSLLPQLETCHGVDSHTAQAALHKLKGHLRYLSEDLAALSRFSLMRKK